MWRALCILLLLAVVGVGVAGYYLEWYHVGKVPTQEGGQTGVQITVDQDKVKADLNKAKERVVPAHGEAERH
jgi:Tfp pilus assembly protein PilN